MRTAIDTNVISALWSGEPTARKMAALLGEARSMGGVVVCAAVYAELLAHPNASQSFVDTFLAGTGVSVDFDCGEDVWREAARGFGQYASRRRSSKGTEPRRLLADFIVGAHATIKADRLLTLDPTRYRHDFATLAIVP